MKFFNKIDMIIILVIIAVSITAWMFYRISLSDQPARAEIYYYSTLVKTVALDKGIDETFSIEQNEHIIFHLYKDGNIRFEQSDCPDQVCVNSGKLHMAGQSAACLPNGIILKIVSDKQNNDVIDAITGN